MKKGSLMAMLALNALALNVMVGVSYAMAEDSGGGLHAPAMEPVRGSVSSKDARADRAAKLKAKMKAIEEGKNRRDTEDVVVPIEHRSVRGSDQIKEKMKASKESGKRGSAKIKSYINGFMGSLQNLSDMISISDDNGELSAEAKKRRMERKMSFKERLKLELEKKKKRNEARK